MFIKLHLYYSRAKAKVILIFDLCHCCCYCSINTQIENNATDWNRYHFSINAPLCVSQALELQDFERMNISCKISLKYPFDISQTTKFSTRKNASQFFLHTSGRLRTFKYFIILYFINSLQIVMLFYIVYL